MLETWLRTVFGLRAPGGARSRRSPALRRSARASRARARSARGTPAAARSARTRRSSRSAAWRSPGRRSPRRRRPPGSRAGSRPAGALEQVAARAGAHRREHRLVVLEHGQHEHADVRVPRTMRASPRCRSTPGICRSITTTSGCEPRPGRPPRAGRASPTTSMSSATSSSARSPCTERGVVVGDQHRRRTPPIKNHASGSGRRRQHPHAGPRERLRTRRRRPPRGRARASTRRRSPGPSPPVKAGARRPRSRPTTDVVDRELPARCSGARRAGCTLASAS